MSEHATTLTCLPVTGMGEVEDGDDLAALLVAAASLRDGDVLVVTSKVVSKAEGRVSRAGRDEAIASQTARIVAVRGSTTIVRTRSGLVMAAAGVDASNTAVGTVVLLPVDPDVSARGLREAIARAGGANVAVVVTDTSGRAWRNGQTDIAIGAAGLDVLDDHSGRRDSHGNLLVVTSPAVADEIAAAADLVKGKLRRCPAAVVRGLDRLVLPAGRHGSGARMLIRAEAQDLFGYGAREAVLRAVLHDPSDGPGFGAPATADEVCEVLRAAFPGAQITLTTVAGGAEVVRVRVSEGGTGDRELGAAQALAATVAFAMGWQTDLTEGGVALRLGSSTP